MTSQDRIKTVIKHGGRGGEWRVGFEVFNEFARSIVSGGGRLGLRARCNPWRLAQREGVYFGIGWIVLDSVHASWKSLIVSSVSELAAEAAVAGFGMVAANIS